MIVSKNGVELRNLQEQVLKNKEDIAAHYNIDRVLADFGIRVIGQVATDADLPDESTFTGSYGDAYAVGTNAPYNFYIWTRADVNAGHPNDYWLDVGPLAIVGPQGPEGQQGEQGPQGTRGSIWVTSGTLPSASGYNLGDQFLHTSNGWVYQCALAPDGLTKFWSPTGSILGPQGPQGPQGIIGPQGPQGPQGSQGPRGDVGGFINIVGILANENQLPTPAELGNLTKAYLVGATSPYDLYIQIGKTPETALWNNVGPLNVATLVTVGGEFQNIWDADTKVGFTDYASTFQHGVIKTYKGFGVMTNSGGYAYVDVASKDEIDNRNSLGSDHYYTPLSVKTLDYAIVVGLTTNTEALTDGQKTSACNWLGAATKEYSDARTQLKSYTFTTSDGTITLKYVSPSNGTYASFTELGNELSASPGIYVVTGTYYSQVTAIIPRSGTIIICYRDYTNPTTPTNQTATITSYTPTT